MPGFDISSILDFNPPKWMCPACRALLRKFTQEKVGAESVDSCPVCRVEFVHDDTWGSRDQGIYNWLFENKYRVDHGHDLLAHSRNLATLIRDAKGNGKYRKPWPSMRLLFEVLASAQSFVHFASWGISHLLVGALKANSLRVPVYGVVSNVEASTRAELVDYPDDAPNFQAYVVPSKTAAFDAPHQKLVVVDGLVAFKGSANLTNAGMRKADRGLDLLEVVTNFEEVVTLNNRYFSPVWKKGSSPDRATFSYDFAPF
jgi:hypothetical protein